jgi:hypothetical protein
MVKLQGGYDSHGPLDQEDTWRKIVMSLTGKSKERGLILAIRSRFDLSRQIKV